jgi:outer membrane protein assembly factor BamD
MQLRSKIVLTAAGIIALCLPSGYGFPFRHKKYETPITKDTLQPDKILFDRAIKNIEHGDYESARLTLNTLINTYDTSEFLAKAKLAIADSWFREGGAHGLAQAEIEYKDFILFYPNLEEAAESQYKICNIHYKQMEKADRDNAQAQRAEDECRQVMVQFPNSKFVPQAQQMLRNTQEVLADKEFRTGDFYHHRGSFPAAANRLAFVAEQYPLYSGSDEALWELADSYRHMGDRFENQEGDALTKLVQDYPLSEHLEAAKSRLTSMNRPVPQADRAAYDHMKYELEARHKPGVVHRTIAPFESHPDTYLAAKSGAPSMQAMRPPTPVSVPKEAAGGQSGINDVTASPLVTDTAAFDKAPEARLGVTGTPAAGAANGTAEPKPESSISSPTSSSTAQPDGPAATAKAAEAQPLPTNHPPTKQQLKAYKKAQEKAAAKAKKQNGNAKPASTPAAAADAVAASANTTQNAATANVAANATAPANAK